MERTVGVKLSSSGYCPLHRRPPRFDEEGSEWECRCPQGMDTGDGVVVGLGRGLGDASRRAMPRAAGREELGRHHRETSQPCVDG
jgi:hypothetical protein